jgi:hypothetical protein
MVTQGLLKYHLPVFWNDEFKKLDYLNEEFNDPANLQYWLDLGFANKFTGDMCDMRQPQPSFNKKFLEIYTEMGWKDIGTSYYRMQPGTILPTHQDLYKRYVQLFELQGKENTIRRAIVYLEDWKSGHYAEYQEQSFTNWRAGDVVEWHYNTPHLAANLGVEPRYTLQITGHI